jgi:hypothetical protein
MAGTCSTHEGDEKYNILVRKPEGKRYSEDLGVDVRIILERIFKK